MAAGNSKFFIFLVFPFLWNWVSPLDWCHSIIVAVVVVVSALAAERETHTQQQGHTAARGLFAEPSNPCGRKPTNQPTCIADTAWRWRGDNLTIIYWACIWATADDDERTTDMMTDAFTCLAMCVCCTLSTVCVRYIRSSLSLCGWHATLLHTCTAAFTGYLLQWIMDTFRLGKWKIDTHTHGLT